MPQAKRSSTTARSRSFREPAALKRFNRSIDTAEQALAELRQQAGRDISQAARELYKDLRTFVSSARRHSGKLAKALERDFETAQKRVAARAGTSSAGARGKRRTVNGGTGSASTGGAARRSTAAQRKQAKS